MKAVIIAPFWRSPGHVGNYRVDRFVRWLSTVDVNIVLVRAGSFDQRIATPWGLEITIADPLKLYTDENQRAPTAPSRRRPNPIRRMLAYAILSPDPTIVWAKRVARHPFVLEHSENASFVLSSSPPESSHIAAHRLATRFGIPLIVDMRDGWLDEPLKPLLRVSRLQVWREGRLERAVLKQAERIFVTSNIWKEMLQARLPLVRGKTIVLTNGCPIYAPIRHGGSKRNSKKGILLVHAGRFTGSSLSRRVELLLKPLHDSLHAGFPVGEILLIGSMENDDLEDVNPWKQRFLNKGWELNVKPAVSRERVLSILSEADGLLLLSASRAAIPSKLFDYLVSERPILVATPRNSAVWEISMKAPQIISFDYSMDDFHPTVERFLGAAQNEVSSPIPSEFREAHLSQCFLEEVLEVVRIKSGVCPSPTNVSGIYL